ncbi:MAG: hypothetical protein K0S33_140 [Bacteroidetes bacterium]|jgi:hypothetical protein|nr:hypothetical protein [Bacteroidota bacterium]
MKNNTRFTLLLLFTGLLLSVRAQKKEVLAPDKKMTSKEIGLLIDSLSSALKRIYIYPEKSALMISSIKKEYKKGSYNAAKDKQELSWLLQNDLLKAHKDGHLGVRFEPEMAMQISTPMTDEERQKQYDIDIKAARAGNFAFRKTEVLPGQIGYVRWDGFLPFVDEAKPTLDAAFGFVSNCKAVIIDMRYNGGGSPDMVLQTQNYFYNTNVHMNDIIDGALDTLKRYTDTTKTSFKLNMPVYILTAWFTFSGAEDFTYGLKKNKRAIVVGDTTGGGAHPTGTYDLGQGFIAFIPCARAPEGEDWEGTGVTPDVPVESEEALAKAQLLIYTDFLAKATNEKEKNMFRWGINSLRAGTAKMPGAIDLTAYTGMYQGGLDFYVKDNRLFCKNAERGGAVYELKYIDEHLFVLDENVQLQFEKDVNGAFTGFKMLWKSGYISQKSKVR